MKIQQIVVCSSCAVEQLTFPLTAVNTFLFNFHIPYPTFNDLIIGFEAFICLHIICGIWTWSEYKIIYDVSVGYRWKIASLLKIHFQIMYMDPCSQLILFFRYLFRLGGSKVL